MFLDYILFLLHIDAVSDGKIEGPALRFQHAESFRNRQLCKSGVGPQKVKRENLRDENHQEKEVTFSRNKND